jgi:hypothetical protein
VLLAGCSFGLTYFKSEPESGALGESGASQENGGVPDEACDGIDNDGDGQVDEGYDADGDGYTRCGSETEEADCDDTDPDVNPGATEALGNSADDDCDGVVDGGEWSSGDLLITEVLYAPIAVADGLGQWIELYNATSRTVDAEGLTFTKADGTSFAINLGAPLPVAPGASFVLAASGDTSVNGNVVADYAYRGVLLDDVADELTVAAGDTVLDSVYWDNGATMPRAIGATLMVDPGSYGESDPRYWCAATQPWTNGGDYGSPAALNEPCATIDHDGDGYTAAGGDCDDTNAAVHPGAASPDATVDWDCDGIRNGTPTASASSTGGAYACDPIQLDGTSSSDPDGDSLSYSWSLVSAPAGSTATTSSIDTTTSPRPTLYADVTGSYVLSLTVSDAVSSSAPFSLTVAVGTRPDNTAPTASAGADQAQAGSADCTPIAYGTGGYDCDDCADATFSLSASGSSDADGDVLSHAWAVTLGGSHATLSTSRGTTTVVTVTGVTANYGSPATQGVVVTLTTTDCMGATSTDDVEIEMQCTGY